MLSYSVALLDAIAGGVIGSLLALVLILVTGILIAALLGFFVRKRKMVPGRYSIHLWASAAVVDPCTHTLPVV